MEGTFKEDIYTWDQFNVDVLMIARFIKESGRKWNGVWGPPRGGLALAVSLSHALDLPLLFAPHGVSTLIVDDIADTGQTLQYYADRGFYIVTLFYHKQSRFVPKYWLREKTDKYIHFPWEVVLE